MEPSPIVGRLSVKGAFTPSVNSVNLEMMISVRFVILTEVTKQMKSRLET
jgi:hypothetical protein